MNFGRNRPVAGHRFGKAVTGVRFAVAAPSCPSMHSWRNGRRSRLRSGRPRGMEVQVLPGAPFLFARRVEDTHFVLWRHANPACGARFAKRPRHRSYTPTFPGSSPGASTIHSPVAQRQSARPITGRPRIVTVRENQQEETTMTTTIRKPGRLAAASPSPMDPERSSLRRLGNGLLIRAPARLFLCEANSFTQERESRSNAEIEQDSRFGRDVRWVSRRICPKRSCSGSTPSGSSNRHHHTRLAQLVRAPSS